MQSRTCSELSDMNESSFYTSAHSDGNDVDLSQGIEDSASLVFALTAEECLKASSWWLLRLSSLLLGFHYRGTREVQLRWADTEDFSWIPKRWHSCCDGRHFGHSGCDDGEEEIGRASVNESWRISANAAGVLKLACRCFLCRLEASKFLLDYSKRCDVVIVWNKQPATCPGVSESRATKRASAQGTKQVLHVPIHRLSSSTSLRLYAEG